MEVKLDLQGTEYRLGEQKEIFIFRIFQELVNNILKHAKATQLTILLNYTSADLFVFSVKDNGVGFSMQEKKDSKSPLNGVGLKKYVKQVETDRGKNGI